MLVRDFIPGVVRATTIEDLMLAPFDFSKLDHAGSNVRLQSTAVCGEHEDERYPFIRGRKPLGRIAVANSDAGSSSLINVAIDQAHRAINELL